MNGLRLAAIGLAFCLAFDARAEPLFVQSGEHENFTRLVLPVPLGMKWKVTHTADQVVLNIEGHGDGFETGTVFDRIARNRISQIQTENGRLTLTLTCDCQVATFMDQGQYVVLDIAANDVTLEGARVGVSPTEGTLEQETAQQAETREVPQEPMPAANVPLTLPLLSETGRASAPALNFPQPVLNRTNLRGAERQVLDDMQQRLAEQLGTAATRGVLSPAPGKTPRQVPQLATLPPQEEDVAESIKPPAPEPFSNIRISSSLDRPNGPSALREILGETNLSCPETGSLDVSQWGDSDPFAVQIAKVRQKLYSEIDRLDHHTAIELAQRYIYFGFGAEARQILELNPVLAREKSALVVMSQVLDGVTPPDSTILIRSAPCDPDALLWATLAQPDPVRGAKPDADAILRSLSKLPPHLRQILAPALSKKLLAYGDEDSAEMALRSLKRLPGPLQSGGRLAQAELNLHKGKTEKGAAQLAEVADENSEFSPSALIALIDAKIADHQPIDIDAANLVAAYAKELKDTELGPELRRAHVLALLKSGQFDQAFSISDDLGGKEDTKAAAELRIQLVRHLTETADDIVFLDHIFDQNDQDIGRLPAEELEALAARFLATGFPERAAATLSYLPLDVRKSGQKILAAQISLALKKPQMAQAHLLGVTGEQADRLRADAKHIAGSHAEAHALYTRAAEPEAAAQTAWLAEDWQGLMPEDAPVFGPARSTATYSNDPLDRAEGMLARSAAVLDESATARQTLSDLLNAEEMRLSETN